MSDESLNGPSPLAFSRFNLPDGQSAWVPDDLELCLPASTSLDPADWHYLIYIPWHDRFLDRIDPAYRDFFTLALPYLHARTTDVHVATCLPFIQELARAESGPVDVQVVTLAFILHNSGWSQMSEREIAQSLGIQGLHLYGESILPKLRHAQLGQQVAKKLLGNFPFQPPFSPDQKEQIYQAVLFHDRPQELAATGEIPTNLKVVCNVDHLWSFTHPNFWQDTLRKAVRADIYLENLGKDLEQYFVSEPGRRKARQLLALRGREVQAWKNWLESHPA